VKKVINWLLMLALLALLAAMVFSKSPSNEERIEQQVAEHGFRPRESYMGDADDPGPEGPYLAMTYGTLPGEVGSHWLLMVFPNEKNGVGFEAESLELALFCKGEEKPRTFLYGRDVLAAALTWSSETENLSLTKRNELFLSRALMVGHPGHPGTGKTRFEPHDMATLVLCVPWDDAGEALGISIRGTDDAGVRREYHNYLTLSEDGGGMPW